MDRRPALSLLELIVVLAILAVLIGLLLPAVLGIRRTALAAQCANRQRQLILAVHSYSSANNGELPAYSLGPRGYEPPPPPRGTPFDPSAPLPKTAPPLVKLLPYLEQGAAYRRIYDPSADGFGSPIRDFRCPLDPTLATQRVNPSDDEAMTSYALSCPVFGRVAWMEKSFSDGLSATFAIAEHFAVCQKFVFSYRYDGEMNFGRAYSVFAGFFHGAPVTRGNPPVTSGRDLPPGGTFQHRPALDECNTGMAQTAHPSGMSVAMADGSVRVIRADVAPAAYWAATTPAGGEVAPLD